MLEPLARVDKTDALALFHAPVGLQAWPIVANLEMQQAVIAVGADGNYPGRIAERDAVTNGVLDQWLQEQIRHTSVQSLRSNLHPHGQPVGESHLLDVKIKPRKLQLFFERPFLFTRAIERAAQEVAQSRNHLHGGLSLARSHQ